MSGGVRLGYTLQLNEAIVATTQTGAIVQVEPKEAPQLALDADLALGDAWSVVATGAYVLPADATITVTSVEGITSFQEPYGSTIFGRAALQWRVTSGASRSEEGVQHPTAYFFGGPALVLRRPKRLQGESASSSSFSQPAISVGVRAETHIPRWERVSLQLVLEDYFVFWNASQESEHGQIFLERAGTNAAPLDSNDSHVLSLRAGLAFSF